MVIYDWLLTFADEIHYIWNRKLTGAKVLFLVNRYIFMALVGTVVIVDFMSGESNIVSIHISIALHDASQRSSLL